jgi:hypothetical protein
MSRVARGDRRVTRLRNSSNQGIALAEQDLEEI